MHALEITGLSKLYSNGVQALTQLDLEIAEGEFFGLIGANGAGKSTLIGSLTGLVDKSAGEVRLFGVDIDRDPVESRIPLGVVPQEINFNLFLKVQETLYNQAGYYGITRREAKGEIERLLQCLDLWEKREEEVRHLSGGMRRRLMIARALVHQPRFLLLDEPTVGLDIALRHTTWHYLQELNRQGVTILLTSHYLEEVEHLCKRAALIERGKVLKIDTIDRLVASLEKQVYIAKLNRAVGIEQLQGFEVGSISDDTVEVAITGEGGLTPFITALHNLGICVTDIRPKSNRLEQLFYHLKRGVLS